MPPACPHCPRKGKDPESVHFNACKGNTDIGLPLSPGQKDVLARGYLVLKGPGQGVAYCCTCQSCALELQKSYQDGDPLVFHSYAYKTGVRGHYIKAGRRLPGGNNWHDRQSFEVSCLVKIGGT